MDISLFVVLSLNWVHDGTRVQFHSTNKIMQMFDATRLPFFPRNNEWGNGDNRNNGNGPYMKHL